MLIFCVLESLKEGKFHQQLREMFAPMVIRYVDLMEASITLCIKGTSFEGGTMPTSTGSVESKTDLQNNANLNNTNSSSGSGMSFSLGSMGSSLASAAANAASAAAASGTLMSAAVNAVNVAQSGGPAPVPVSAEELIWKLEALQTFIRELHWTDLDFAEHLDNRLKMMAADMIDAAAERYLKFTFLDHLMRLHYVKMHKTHLKFDSLITAMAPIQQGLVKTCNVSNM